MIDMFQKFAELTGDDNSPKLVGLSVGMQLESSENRLNEWLAKRLGKFTASGFYKLMGYEDRNELSKGSITYARTKAIEILTASTASDYDFVNNAIQWGIDHEYEALDAFIASTGFDVENGKDDQIFMLFGDSAGGTPDGIMPTINAGVEIKCPNSETHLHYLSITDAASLKRIASNYYWQVQGLMLISGFESWFFVSYDPRFIRHELKLHIATIKRDHCDIAKLQCRLQLAIKCRDDIIQRYSLQ